MKKFLASLVMFAASLPLAAQTATVNGQRVNFRVLVGSAAPSSGTCDASSERGSIYMRTGDQATVPTQFYACKQTGAATYGWGPIGWYSQTTAPATCGVSEVWFDTDATAGENLNLCTSADTWTAVSGGGGGNVTLKSGTADPNDMPETCTPSSSSSCLYLETDANKWWIATATDTWEILASSTGTGAVNLSGTEGDACGDVGASEFCLRFASGVAYVEDSTDAAISTTVKPTTATSNQFLTHVDSTGTQTKAQPAFSDLSGTATAAQTPTSVLDDSVAYCADAGGTDTYACTLSPAPGSYVTGARYRFKANTANTGAATINFNSLGAKTIVKVAGGITTALSDNDIRSGQFVDLVYDGTNMQMQSTLGNAAAGGSANLLARGGETAGVTNTGSAVTIYSQSVPSLAAGACLKISSRVYAPAGSFRYDVYVDATVIATPYNGLNDQNMSAVVVHCNTTAQSAQQTSYIGPAFYVASTAMPVTSIASNVDTAGFTTSSIDWSTSHTVAIKTTGASGDSVGKYWVLELVNP